MILAASHAPWAESGGAIGVIETVFPPGDGVPFHKHSSEDETFYVVSGTGEFRPGAGVGQSSGPD
jgi:quercetin dioxygenase-like cupin family protein